MNNLDDVAIKVQGVSKSFKLPHEKQSSIKGVFLSSFKGKRSYETQKVLENISFEIKKGDFFGIVGRNGSGKSTLLKLMAGIYTPDKGAITVNGKLTPFIELGVGFNPELTGRENVFLNGALLGFSRKEMAALYDEIVEFAELKKFMDQKLKNYSSGMQVRLAFSIAVQANTDILVLDEVLAVGDEAFQQKCYDYFGSLKRQGKTVVLVTHDMGAVERFCSKALLIERGDIVKMGSSAEIADMYRELFFQQIKEANKKENFVKQSSRQKISEETTRLTDVIVKQNDKKVTLVKALKPFEIQVMFESKEDLGRCICGINVINSQNLLVLVAGTGTIHDDPLVIKKGKNVIKFKIEENIYNQDSYYINVALARGDDANQKLIIKEKETIKFSIRGIKTRKHSLTHPKIITTVEQ